jgi:hypothetical protein
MKHKEVSRVNEIQYIEKRKDYAVKFNSKFLGDFRNIVFVDESSFNNHLRKSQGRSPKGSRVNVKIPVLRGRSVSLISSMSLTGVQYSKLISQTTVNGNVFALYFDELCNFLKNNKGLDDICFILDNARIHKRNDLSCICNRYGYILCSILNILIC